MSKKEIRTKLKLITKKIVREFEPEKIILFGSHVWGKPNKDSDVDLFVLKNTKKNKFDAQREIRTKIFPPELPVDILVYTPKEVEQRIKLGDFFVKDIFSKGEILYVAK